MSQRHTDGMILDWFDEWEHPDSYLEKLLPAGIRCCNCHRYIETRFYHEDHKNLFWCDGCVGKTPGMFWLREQKI